MLDLQLLAYQTDTTRVFSMILAREVSSRPYPHIGVPDQHHVASHHRDDAGLIEKKTKIDAYHVSLLGYLAEKMRTTSDGDGTLLDQSLLVYGGGMGDGNLHQHTDLPCVLLGKLGGTVKARPAHRVPERHADDEPAADGARQGRRQRRRHRRQHGTALARLPDGGLTASS